MNQVKIGGRVIPAAVRGKMADPDWDGRESKAITLKITYEEARELFTDNQPWWIVYRPEGEPEEEFDNRDFSVAGSITDHRDGTVTCKMGKLTALEETLALFYGGEAE